MAFIRRKAGLSLLGIFTTTVTFANAIEFPDWSRAQIASQEEITGQNNSETELFQYSEERRIFVLDFGGKRGLRHRGETLNRIAAFLDAKDAPKDKLLTDKELGRLIWSSGENHETFFLAHCFKASDLIKFFNTADASSFQLNKEELKLRDMLIRNLFMQKNRIYKQVPPEKILIAIPEEQKENLKTLQEEAVTSESRRMLFRHEMGHAKYFLNPKYRKYCKQFFQKKITPEIRIALIHFFKNYSYDSGNEDLLINEIQAYVIHTPLEYTFSHFDFSLDALRAVKKEFLASMPANGQP